MRHAFLWGFVLVGLELAACGDPPPASGPAPGLDRPGLERAVVRADDLRRQALGGAAADGLEEAFTGAALDRLRRRVAEMRRRQQRLEERLTERNLVHAGPDGARPEGVMAVSAEQRLVSPDHPDTPWSRTLRQWQATLVLVDGRWLVAEDRELAPDRWWR